MFMWKLLNLNKISFTRPVLTIQELSSTYLFHLRNKLPCVGAIVVSSYTTKIPGSIGPKGDPSATPSVC